MAKRKSAAPRRTKQKTANRPAWLDEGAALIAQRRQELAEGLRRFCVEMGGQVAAYEKDADQLRQLEREWIEYSESKYGNGVLLTGDLASENRADEAAYRAAKAKLSESLGIGDNPPPVKHVERRSASAFRFPATDFESLGMQAEDVVWGVGVALPTAAPDAPAPAGTQASHADDYRSVNWYGQEYVFTANQAACVKTLWEHWERGTRDVGGDTILEAAESDAARLDLVFRDHPAWKTMIVQGGTKGTYRLNPPK